MTQTSGRGDALRKEKGGFAYFCRRMDKSKASGSTRTADFKALCFRTLLTSLKLMASDGSLPAGFVFQKKQQGQQMNHLLPSLASSLLELCQQPRRPVGSPSFEDGCIMLSFVTDKSSMDFFKGEAMQKIRIVLLLFAFVLLASFAVASNFEEALQAHDSGDFKKRISSG